MVYSIMRLLLRSLHSANHYAQPITPANSEDITAFVIDNPLQFT